MSVSPVGTLTDGRSIMFDSGAGMFAIDGGLATPDDIRNLDGVGQVAWISPYVQAWFAASFVQGVDATYGVAPSGQLPSSSPMPTPKERLGGLPVWGWVLMWVFLWPVALTWALVAMWREARLTLTARIAWTAVAAAVVLLTLLSVPPSVPSEPAAQIPAAAQPISQHP